MVFESVVAEILNIYIGDYVENLDRSQLQIGIWGGDVVLQDLVLKPTVLDELHLPVKCIFGHLGRLVLKIPWKNLYKAPVIAKVERLFLLAAPDPHFHSYSAQKWKLAEIQRLEVARQLKLQAEQTKTSDTFVEKLTTQIIKNIQINIENIHIRYEDEVTVPKCPFSVGFTLHHLSVQSADSNWKEGMVQDTSSMFYKVLDLEGFAVYWNCNSQKFSHEENLAAKLLLFQKGICVKDILPAGFSYMFGPINCGARLQLNPNPEGNDEPFKIPKALLSLMMEKLSIGLSKEQYHRLIDLLDFFDFSNKVASYQQFRPDVPKARGNYKEWWKFAVKCILSRRWRGVDWQQVKTHRNMCRTYASLYMKKLQHSGVLPPSLIEEIADCEQKLDVFNIMLIRRQVEAEVEWLNRQNPKEQTPQGITTWLSSWWGGASQENDLTDKFNHELTAKERLKLYQALDYEENAIPALYPDDFVERKVLFVLGKLTVEVRDDTSRLLLAELSGVESSLEQRPVAGGLKIDLKMTQLSAWGADQNQGCPQLVQSITNQQDGVLMRLFLEVNPLNSACGRRLRIHAAPLQLVYDSYTFIRLQKVFQGPQPDVLVQLQAAAGAQLSEMSALGLQYAIEHHVMTEVEVDLKSSYVLIPYKGSYSRSGDLLVLNLGQLSVMTLPRDLASDPRILQQLGHSKTSIVETMRAETYDRFLVELKHVQVLLAFAGEDWEQVLQNQKRNIMHLLEPMSLACNVEKCLIRNDPSLPNVKVSGKLSTVSFTFEDSRLIHLVKLYDSIPFSESQETQNVVKYSVPEKEKIEDILQKSGAAPEHKEVSVNMIELDLKFTMEGVTATFYKSAINKAKVEPQQLIQAKTSLLGLVLVKCTNNMSVSARLGGVMLAYTDHEGTRKLLDPKSPDTKGGAAREMLTMKYTSVDKDDATGSKAEQFLEADFSHLTILLHREVIESLVEYSQNLIQRLEAAVTQKSLSSPPAVKQKNTKSRASSAVSIKRKEFSFKMSLRLHALHVCLQRQLKPLAHLLIEGMEVSSNSTHLSTNVSARLRNVSVDNPDTSSTHRQILSILGSEALSVDIVTYPASTSQQNKSASMSIKAKLARSQIVFLNSFVVDIVDFLSCFQKAQENFAHAVAEAAEAAKQKVMHVHAESQFVSLDLSFQAPLITVPVNASSLEALQLDFGKLTIRNKLGKVQERAVDLIRLELQHLQVTRVVLSKQSEVVSEQKIVKPVSVTLEVIRSLVPQLGPAMPEVAMNGHLDSVQAALYETDVKLIMRIMAENLSRKNKRMSQELSPTDVRKVQTQSDSAMRWNFALRMSTLELDLGLNAHHLVHFTMTGLDLAAAQMKHLRVKFCIKDLIAYDTALPKFYQKVIAVEGSETLSVDVVIYDTNQEPGCNNMMVKATMARIQFIYLPSIMSAMKEFLQAFDYKPEELVEAVAGVAEAARGEVWEAHTQASKIGLDIDLKAPVIIIPHHVMNTEALLLDFGNLTIKNEFETLMDAGHPAVIDKISLGLHNLKLSRVQLGLSGELVSECWLLQPVNLVVQLKRKLNPEGLVMLPDLEIIGQLHSVVVAVNQDDVQMVMNTLNSFSAAEPQHSDNSSLSSRSTIVAASSISSQSSGSPSALSTTSQALFMKFSFTMDKLVVELFDEQPQLIDFENKTGTHAATSSLACCSLVMLVVQGAMARDGTLTTSVLLSDCQLDDSRPERQVGFTRLMESKHSQTLGPDHLVLQQGPKTRNLEVYYSKKGLHSEVKVRVYSFNLVLSLEYTKRLGEFFSKAFVKSAEAAPKSAAPMAGSVSVGSGTGPSVPKQSSFSFIVHAEKPDVFLVEDMGDPDTTALVLRSDIKCAIMQGPVSTQVKGSVQELQLYSCRYHPDLRKDTMSQILQPCSVDVEGTTSRFQVKVSKVRVRVSPGTLGLLSRVMGAMWSKEEAVGENEHPEVDCSDIWTPKFLKDTDHWFLRTEIAEDALEMTNKPVARPSQVQQKEQLEMCVLKAPSIAITMEVGAGSQTLPVVLLTAGMETVAKNWSQRLVLESTVSLQMAYYNSLLALWEPLIEPVEIAQGPQTVHRPWELTAKIQVDNSSQNGNGTDGTSDQTCMNIDVRSKDSLEMTLTKVGLEVLTSLGQAFQLAVDELRHEGPAAPYQVINHTGVPILVLLGQSPFTEYDPKGRGKSQRVLQPGESMALKLEEVATLSSPLHLMTQRQAEERYLKIQVGSFGDFLELPVVQASQRHFPLNGDLALISDVRVESGSTIITLRSILQVFNNLGMTIDVHYQPGRTSSLKLVGSVASGEHLDVPFEAVYAPDSEVFISVQGYSKVCYSWNYSFSLKSTVLHECTPSNKSSNESVFFRILRYKKQAYFRGTNTQGSHSVYFKLLVQPAVKIKNLLPVGVVVSQLENNMVYALAPGDRLNLATARPDGSKLRAQIPEYRQQEWTCTFAADNSASEFSVIKFHTTNRTALLVGLHSISKSGVYIATLYSPYWMLNKTGLPLSFKLVDESTRVPYHQGDSKSAVMFPCFGDSKRAAVQVADGQWSESFSLDVTGSSGIVNCPALGQVYRLGVSIQLMRCTLTKQVTFTPYFVLINACRHTVECQEAERPADLWVRVEAGGCCALWPVVPDKPVMLRARVANTRQISVPFLCTQAHTTLLRLDNQWGGLNVDVQLTESSVYVRFADYEPGQAPVLLVNHSRTAIPYSEKGSNDIHILNPSMEVLYTWMMPAGDREMDFITHAGSAIDRDVCRMSTDASSSYTPQPRCTVYWSSFLDGAQRVMLFTSDPAIAQSGQEGGTERVRKSLTVNLQGLCLSLVDNEEAVEVLYIGVSRMPASLEDRYNKPLRNEKRCAEVGLWMQVTWLPHEMRMHAKLEHLQADCQLPECTYPVALAPVPPSRSVATSNVARPFVEMSVVVRQARHSSLQQVQYCKVLIQAFYVKLDMGLMSALTALLVTGEPSDEVEVSQFLEDLRLVSAALQAHVAIGSARGQKLLFHLLHLSPLKIHLSLSLSDNAGLRKGHEPPHALLVLLRSLGVTFTNVHDVVFRLAFFECRNMLLSRQELVGRAANHYRNQVLNQLYVLVLGLDVLGNPFGFFKGLKQGVEDMFYEPIQGAIQGPEELARGLALGVRSLLGHTVGGAAGAMSRITGAMGSGVAALTFDKEFQRKRQENISQRPGTVQQGLAQSGKGLVMGVVDGVSGVFLKPISGAKKEGVEGFFKGVGKGVAGLVARPTAGIMDFATGSLDAVRRSTEITVAVERQRPPRFLQADGRVCPYTRMEAEGNRILQEVEDKKYASDKYVGHTSIGTYEQSILLLTNQRVMFISRKELLETWKLDWQEPWEAVNNIKLMEDGILLVLNNGNDFKPGSTRRIFINNPEVRAWIFDKMRVLRKL